MAEHKIVAGDVVQVKSGGPQMTVINGPDENAQFFCQWFDDKGNPRASSFYGVTLEWIDPNRSLI